MNRHIFFVIILFPIYCSAQNVLNFFPTEISHTTKILSENDSINLIHPDLNENKNHLFFVKKNVMVHVSGANENQNENSSISNIESDTMVILPPTRTNSNKKLKFLPKIDPEMEIGEGIVLSFYGDDILKSFKITYLNNQPFFEIVPLFLAKEAKSSRWGYMLGLLDNLGLSKSYYSVSLGCYGIFVPLILSNDNIDYCDFNLIFRPFFFEGDKYYAKEVEPEFNIEPYIEFTRKINSKAFYFFQVGTNYVNTWKTPKDLDVRKYTIKNGVIPGKFQLFFSLGIRI